MKTALSARTLRSAFVCLGDESVVLRGGDLTGLLEALHRNDHILDLHLKETIDRVRLLFSRNKTCREIRCVDL